MEQQAIHLPLRFWFDDGIGLALPVVAFPPTPEFREALEQREREALEQREGEAPIEPGATLAPRRSQTENV